MEIETDIESEEFERIIEGEYVEKDIQKRKVLEANNLYNLTKMVIADTIKNQIELSIDTIKTWRLSLFLGIREDAGKFSKKIRKIKDSDLTFTHPEDIDEEMEFWIKSYKNASNIYDIAKAIEEMEKNISLNQSRFVQQKRKKRNSAPKF